MKTIAFAMLFAVTASADVVGVHTPPEFAFYKCRVLLSAADIKPDGFKEWNFPSSSGGSHGGDAIEFKADGHEISVIADKQWMGVSWVRAGRKVAESVFVVGSEDRPEFRVGIVKDPGVDGDQVAISCDAYKKP